jgi:hypothetical protein
MVTFIVIGYRRYFLAQRAGKESPPLPLLRAEKAAGLAIPKYKQE